MANTVLAKMAVQIAANTADFNKALTQTNQRLDSFANNITRMAGIVGIAFGVEKIAAFTLEASKLAAETQGVKSAFDKLPGSVRLLEDLTTATENTVGNLSLMKLSVEALNNKVPIQNLAEILAFVDKTADSTGASFQQLANTIIKDIGNESTRGLNELGLSIETIKTRAEAIGFVPALMEEIRRKNKELGVVSSEVADNFDRVAASIENFKVAWGNFANSALVNNGLVLLTNFINGLTELGQDFDKIYLPWGQVIDFTRKAKDETKVYTGEVQKSFRESIKGANLFEKPIETIATLTERLKVLEAERIDQSGQTLAATNREIKAIEAKIVALKNLGIASKDDPVDSLTRQKTLNAPLTRPIDASGTLIDEKSIEQSIQKMVELIQTIKTLPVEFRKVAEETVNISGLIVGGIVDIADAFGQAAVTGAQDFGRAFLRSLATFAQQFGAMLISIGIGEKFLKTGTPGQKIAAGIALVALGGAVKALLSKPPSVSGSSGGIQTFNRPSVAGSAFSDIKVSGRLIGEGSTLIAVIGNAEADNGRRRG